MSHSVAIDIGINGAFLTRRWEDPDNWMRLTRETGYSCHEFCADVLDPFFSGDSTYQLAAARSARQAAERYGITIVDVYTGVATHRFHGLSHSDPSVRARMVEWIEKCMDLCLEMGTTRIGGHWDAFSVEALDNPERRARAWDTLVQTFRQLAATGKEKGIGAIYQEQMYIPSEEPWTIASADRFLREVNEGRPGCPVLLT
ncbi:MAG: sugar phosphate isomerase/epimerase, partial [Chloroflexi bacterium]|nr:sugar phosphate isomerase/epimerase [Chloroflexota bacterium]